jgi:hypothetical protein
VSRQRSERLQFLLDTVEKEKRHLLLTTSRLFASEIDASWVSSLESHPDVAERLDAFVARFNRMQDTIGDKLIPELMRNLLETPGAALDNLNRMEKLGLVRSVDDWVEARNLRNKLVHEYMHAPAEFAAALNRAKELVPLLVETYDALSRYSQTHLAESGR